MSGFGYDLKDEKQAKEYLEKLGIEYRYQCYGEKKPDGCHRLAEFLHAFTKEPVKARLVYEKNCSENKYGMSCYKLGNCYLQGTGGEQNNEEALRCYIAGCEYGYAPSCDNAGSLYLDKKRLGDQCQPELAVRYMEKACEMKDGMSCQRVSEMYIRGLEGIQKDMKKAFTYSSKSCDLGSYRGCGNLSIMYKRGDGVEADATLAKKFRQKAETLHREEREVTRQLKFGE